MDGPGCPVCQTPMWWYVTSHEWHYYCKICKKRYTQDLEVMTLDPPKPVDLVGVTPAPVQR